MKEKVMDLLTLIKKKSSPLKKLEIAIEENNIKELKEVLESGEVDPNTEIQKHGGNCAVHIAAHKGLFLCVETLLKYGADPDKTNHFNLTPLYIEKLCKMCGDSFTSKPSAYEYRPGLDADG